MLNDRWSDQLIGDHDQDHDQIRDRQKNVPIDQIGQSQKNVIGSSLLKSISQYLLYIAVKYCMLWHDIHGHQQL